ncbi:MAG: ferrous iron transport protein B [candidate division Zixibacteria bacterium]|nr:ferrous iron transport protein B [candidate division Zixibacteria bacterium]
MKTNSSLKIAFAGNPNSGKTSIFNSLTGARQKVANFPGVTVEKRVGHLKYGKYDITFVDLPGTYSLTAYSLDEKVTRDYIINEKPDVIINVIDGGNLERSLYLTMQLIEIGVDLVIGINMWDEVIESGIKIDTEKLSTLLGAPVHKTIGNRGKGVDSLLATAVKMAENGDELHHHPPVSYGPRLDDIVTNISDEVSKCKNCNMCHNSRWVAIKLLEGDSEIKSTCFPDKQENLHLTKILDESVTHLKSTSTDDPEIIVTEGRHGYVAGIIREVIKRPATDRMKLSDRIDYLLTHRLLGFPIFFLIIWMIFQATFVIGEYPMAWIETVVGHIQTGIGQIVPDGAFADLLINGIIGGVGSVIVFMPNIIILFLGISILEDSGYMARAAFLMDKLMHFLGLHGKSFIPMLMGFGCSVPAIMATRTLESKRDRILTILLIPMISCSARLPVYVLFAGAFFGAYAGNIIFSIYMIGIAATILMARIFSRTILKSDETPFVMELPPYRRPTTWSVIIHMWERTRMYLKKMGGVILIASVILWLLGYFPKVENYSLDYDAQIEQLNLLNHPDSEQAIAKLRAGKAEEDLQYSFIGRLGNIVSPLVSPLGFNWQMGISLIPGFVAKEVVVSSLGVLYFLGEDTNESSESLMQALQNPKSGITSAAAYAFMIFILLYTPCLATVVAIKKEAGVNWMWFSIIFQCIFAWVGAFLVFRILTYFAL